MIERLSSDRFSWTIIQDERGLTTTLTDHEKDRTKVFFQAGSCTVSMMNEHMKSLTDELCEGFWPQPRVKKEKKAKVQNEVQD